MRSLIKLSSASEIDLSRWGLKTFCVCARIKLIISLNGNQMHSALGCQIDLNLPQLLLTQPLFPPLTAPFPADFL